MLDFEVEFAGEPLRFAMPLSALTRIETERGPIGEIAGRLTPETGCVIDATCILQAGLEGAGMEIGEARKVINDRIPGRVPQALALAARVLEQATVGLEPNWESEDAASAARAALVDIRSIWRAGGAIGVTPTDINAMTLAEIQAMFEGHVDANTPKEKRKGRPDAEAREAIKEALNGG